LLPGELRQKPLHVGNICKSILNQFALIGIQRILEIKNTQYESEVVILTSGPLVEKSEVEFLAAELGI
jgi:hypothetical protein